MLPNDLKYQTHNPKTEEKQLLLSKDKDKVKTDIISFISTLYKKINRTQKD